MSMYGLHRSASSMVLLCGLFLLTTCNPSSNKATIMDRIEIIDPKTHKMTPAEDSTPPIIHHDGWHAPVPLDAAINKASGEDSPCYDQQNNALYFFFTPDTHLPAEQQLGDGATGIYVSYQTQKGWSAAERVLLSETQESVLDGCPFILGEELWFCSVRAGNLRDVDLWKADWDGQKWSN